MVIDGAGNGDMSGIICLSAAIRDNGAMTTFDISENMLCAGGARVLAEALRGNSVMTEINMSSNYLGMFGDVDMSGIAVLADVVPGMGALTTLVLRDNKLLTPEAGKILSGMLAANTVLTELDVSHNNWREDGRMKGDGPGFAKELAVGIRVNGALVKLDISSNIIGAAQERDLQRICVASGIDLAK
jgi:hypothetical protein